MELIAQRKRTVATRKLGIRLLHDCVLVRLIAPERIVHGLYIPDTAKRQPWELWRATVLACGPGKRGERRQIPNEAHPNPEPIFTDRLTPCQAQPGDTVLFHWAAGKMLITAWPDEQHRIIRDEQIQAVIE